jgi:hypothetical protein
LVNVKSTSASAFATKPLARCNSSFKGTAESGSIVLPTPELQPKYYNEVMEYYAIMNNSSYVEKFYKPGQQ